MQKVCKAIPKIASSGTVISERLSLVRGSLRYEAALILKQSPRPPHFRNESIIGSFFCNCGHVMWEREYPILYPIPPLHNKARRPSLRRPVVSGSARPLAGGGWVRCR